MKGKGIILLKILLAVIVFTSISLYVLVIPNNEPSYSILKSVYDYNYYNIIDDNDIALSEEKNEINNITIKDEFLGTVTAYGPDCIGCSGITASGYKVGEMINGVINSTTLTYPDEEYGKLRILAADSTLFPYGTVIRISGEKIEGYINGIVLDTGAAMKNALANNEILIDILFASEKNNDVYEFGRQKNVKFEVLRYGY